jgi:hypothetical protein
MRDKIVAAVCEGYSLSLDGVVFSSAEDSWRRSTGEHIGAQILKRIIETPDQAHTLISRSRKQLQQGDRARHKLFTLASDLNNPYSMVHSAWVETITTYYKGALDQVIPFAEALSVLKTGSILDPFDIAYFDMLLGPDGRNVALDHRRSLLLHLAFIFRAAPYSTQLPTYDGFSRRWLELNYIALGPLDGFDTSGKKIEEAIQLECEKLGIIRNYKYSLEDKRRCFNLVRNALLGIAESERDARHRYQRAVETITKSSSKQSFAVASSLCHVLGSSIAINEDIHRSICLAANILRCAAVVRGMQEVPK